MPRGVEVRWFGRQAKAHIARNAGARIRAAAIHFQNKLREEVSIKKVSLRKRTRGGRRGNRRAYESSPPGGFPYLRTGHLRRGITYEYDAKAKTARVGTNVLYGKFLELGTRRMARRPWLSLGIRKYWRSVQQILKSGRVPGRSGRSSLDKALKARGIKPGRRSRRRSSRRRR